MKILRLAWMIALLGGGLSSAIAEDYYDQLRAEAAQEAPGEVQLHVIKTHGQLSDFTSKIREVVKVPGWAQIRVEGEAAFSAWDSYRKDYVWRHGRFEVLFDIGDRENLKLNSVRFDGQTTHADF